jgi:hypothetical protein
MVQTYQICLLVDLEEDLELQVPRHTTVPHVVGQVLCNDLQVTHALACPYIIYFADCYNCTMGT